MNFVSEDQEEDNNDNEHWPIFSLSGKHGRVKAIKISLTLEGEPIEMDTGASLSKLPLKSRYGGLNKQQCCLFHDFSGHQKVKEQAEGPK